LKTSFWVEKNILQLEVMFSTSKCSWNVVETIVENLEFSSSDKNLNIFFSRFLYIHAGNMLFVNDTPYKSMFNNSYNVTSLELFNCLHGDNQYLLGSILPYLEHLHLSIYDVPTLLKTIPLVGLDVLIQII